tara:strand:- start:284 stop:649 length:366 start_codon:yes stop_codon:yes gene_type:complete
MSYIQYTDDSWWKREKEDDNEDSHDIGGIDGIEPMPPPNVNMGEYNAIYGNFETRFGMVTANDNKYANNNSNSDSDANPISQSSQSFTLGHFLGIMVIVIIIVILYRRYNQFRNKENVINY